MSVLPVHRLARFLSPAWSFKSARGQTDANIIGPVNEFGTHLLERFIVDEACSILGHLELALLDLLAELPAGHLARGEGKLTGQTSRELTL